MNPVAPDPWKVLGVEKTADKNEIRTAYKKLVLKCHPDKVQDPALKAQKQDEFQRVQQAYELLNNDAERIKYEDQLKLQELRKKTAMLSKNMANSFATRTSPKMDAEYVVRTTGEPWLRSGATVYSYMAYRTRSSDDVPNPSVRPVTVDEERRASRRTASYEYQPKPTKRDDERRGRDFDRRRRRDDEEEYKRRDRERDREREKEKEKEKERGERSDRERERERDRAKEAERARVKSERRRVVKEIEREKERERRAMADEKIRRNNSYKDPYVELQDEEEATMYAALAAARAEKEKKSSSSRKHGEVREKSSTRRERAPSPSGASVANRDAALEAAKSYIEQARGQPLHTRAHVTQESAAAYDILVPPVAAPTPPPASDTPLVDDGVLPSSFRAASRRSSHEVPLKIKEQIPSLSYKRSPRASVRVVDASSPMQYHPPSFSRSHTAPPVVPGSPPTVSRAQTLPQEMYTRAPFQPVPHMSRQHTWTHGESHSRSSRGSHDHAHYEDGEESRRAHRNRRTRSPPSTEMRYKVQAGKTSKLSDATYAYMSSPSPDGYIDERDVIQVQHFPTNVGARVPFGKVSEAKTIRPEDIQYSKRDVKYTTSIPFGYTGPHDPRPVYA